jgi:hypothetical protein
MATEIITLSPNMEIISEIKNAKKGNKFTVENLNKLANEYKAVIVSYEDKLGSDSTITYNCHCGRTNQNKAYKSAIAYGFLCSYCVKKYAGNLDKIETKSKTPKYTQNNLIKAIKNDEAILIDELEKETGETIYIKKENIINFKCKCGQITSKSLRKILETSASCPECTRKNGKEKSKETCLQKYGTEFYFQTEKCKENNLKIINEKYKCDNVSQNPEIKEKKKQTCIKNWGVDNPSKSSVLIAKITKNREEAIFKKHGVYNYAQTDEFMDKFLNSSYNNKPYKFPSGKIVKVMGYENKAIDELLKSGIDEDDIVTDHKIMPCIKYITPKDNRLRRYFPDIYIKSQNKIIEVKSVHIFKLDYYLNLQKRQACIDAGLNFEFWIYFNLKQKEHFDETHEIVNKKVEEILETADIVQDKPTDLIIDPETDTFIVEDNNITEKPKNIPRYAIINILDNLQISGARPLPCCDILNVDNVMDKFKAVDRNLQLKFICKCGKEGSKSVRKIIESGAECTTCRHRRANEKLMDKNEKLFGVRCNFQRPDVKQKIADKL